MNIYLDYNSRYFKNDFKNGFILYAKIEFVYQMMISKLNQLQSKNLCRG